MRKSATAQFAIGVRKNIHLSCKKSRKQATDESLARDETPCGVYGTCQLNYDTIPKNRRSPRNRNRQQDKRRSNEKAYWHLFSNHSPCK